MKKIKVLHVGVDNIGHGGRSTVAFNLTDAMSSEQIKNDFLAEKKIDNVYEQKIKENNGEIVYLGNLSNNKIIRKAQRANRIVKVLKENKYDIVHIHGDDAWEVANTTILTKLAKIPNIIVHAHSSGNADQGLIKKMLINLFRPVLNQKKYTKFAVTNEAALYMYGSLKDVKVIRNGIHVERYRYDANIRKEMRKILSLNPNFVIGCVARMTPVKNHYFLIDVFKKVLDMERNAKLVLVGNGELSDKIKEYVCKSNLGSQVLFLGNRKDVSDIMQALDVFVLPSIHEGLGLVNIEAQSAGLPCVVSDGVPQSAKVLDDFKFLSLKESKEKWAQEILKFKNFNRIDTTEKINQAEYNIKDTAEIIGNIYLKLVTN